MELCKRHKVSMHILWGCSLIAAWTPEVNHRHVSSVALTIHGSHAYFYANPKTTELISKLKLHNPSTNAPTQVAIAPRSDDPVAKDWKWLPADLSERESGHHYY